MARTRKAPVDHNLAARQYIDQIVAINRRHGMSRRQVPAETYNRAVQDAARVPATLQALGRPVSPG